MDYRQLLLDTFQAAVAAAAPALRVPAHLPPRPTGRTIIVGAGKAAASMAAAVESHWHGPLEGLVVTRYGHGVPCKHIEVVEASHPVPDEAGSKAARRILDKVSGLTADDLVLVLISGGGSALLALPADGITLADKQAVNRALLKCGADIAEMNTVRKHLSAIKGGRLAVAAAPARVVTLAISDVPGDDLSVVGSGPTVPDVSTRADALAVLTKYRIEIPASVAMHLGNDASETPKPGDPRFANVTSSLVGTAQKSLEAAAKVVRGAGLPCMILGNAIEGEARDVGIVHAGVARQCGDWGQPLEIPCVLISGGETTVTVRGSGRGGRNAEFLLSLGIAADGRNGIWALAADTDGIDGSEDNAGAILTPDMLQRARAFGIDAKASLDLIFGLEQGADWVALSFVQKAEDIAEARTLIGSRAFIMAKLEKPAAIDNLDAIVALADGIMVARGDLGVELPPAQVPIIQRRIIRACRRSGKPVVVATQMTAVYEGSDAVILSAESASGNFPREAVAMMGSIIRGVEGDVDFHAPANERDGESGASHADAICSALRLVAGLVLARATVAYTRSGFTSMRAARERPAAPILSLTPLIATARQLTPVWGIHSVVVENEITDEASMTSLACDAALAGGFGKPGDNIVIVAGVPFGVSGTTNLLRVTTLSAAPPN